MPTLPQLLLGRLDREPWPLGDARREGDGLFHQSLGSDHAIDETNRERAVSVK